MFQWLKSSYFSQIILLYLCLLNFNTKSVLTDNFLRHLPYKSETFCFLFTWPQDHLGKDFVLLFMSIPGA